MLQDGCWAMYPAREQLVSALLRSLRKDGDTKDLIRARFYSYTVIFPWLSQSRSVVQM